ncbi:Uncharacterised protein [Citrobacter koseri]|nr:Uncharacterised protein [Citrobacter koseri]
MSSRRYGSQSLQRLLGHWQETPSRTPVWRQLAEALRLLILDGRLALDSRLPGERELAAVLKIQPNHRRQRNGATSGRRLSGKPSG